MDEPTYTSMPEFTVMREVRLGTPAVVTTLFVATGFGKQELVELYGRRWQIEPDFRAIKTVM